ncbi:MAG: TlpA family protein disulfide reductase, partial [Christensenellales bacterium]
MFKTKKVFALITALTMASALGAGAAADAAVIAPEDANVISAADADMAFAAQYNLGDSVEDFDITLSDGTETSLYKLLAEKKAVMLNFWASWCGPCMSEFPHMNEAAAAAPDMAVVALSIEESDTDESIAAIKADSQLDAIMMGRDAADMYSRFDREGAIPLSVIIDKNGVLCYMELGAQPSAEAFSGLFSVFTAADYDAPVLIGGENVDTSREVDVERPAAADAEKALGIAEERISVTQDAADDTWPFVVGEDGLAASNGDVTGSIAHIGLTVNVQAGEALKYEYRVASEASDLDVLSVHADGTARRAYVDAAQWRTDCVVFDEAGEHSVDFVMARGYDAQSEAGIRGVSIISAEEAAALEAEKPERPAALEDAQG